MAELQFGANEEENEQLRKLNAEVLEDPDAFEPWQRLVAAAEGLEGGLTRNSSPQAIASTRSIYDRFLAKFPLFFGYWKKYADLEFAIAGTEAAELVYERGVASIPPSVDLWANYCQFKTETTHDPDIIRELFERGAKCVGLDFLSHPFWDKYIEFEERAEAHDHIFAILARVVHMPMHQYARYFERYRQLAATRPVDELGSAEDVERYRAEAEQEAGPNAEPLLRSKLDTLSFEVFQRCQTETTKRWTYEQEIKRPYFHVTELDDAQLSNWNKYLDFEESEGDVARITFLYERCLIAAASYDDFWLRYARWMLGQPGKTEEVRNIYQRASCIYAPIARPTVRLQWALFEEMSGRVDVAQAIYEGMLEVLPGDADIVVAWASSVRRQDGVDAAAAVFRAQAEAASMEQSRAALVCEWARLLWKIKGAPPEARQLLQAHEASLSSSNVFWKSYLLFEIEQFPSDEQDALVRGAFERAKEAPLDKDAQKELSQIYMTYLVERGGSDSAKEYMALDRSIHSG